MGGGASKKAALPSSGPVCKDCHKPGVEHEWLMGEVHSLFLEYCEPCYHKHHGRCQTCGGLGKKHTWKFQHDEHHTDYTLPYYDHECEGCFNKGELHKVFAVIARLGTSSKQKKAAAEVVAISKDQFFAGCEKVSEHFIGIRLCVLMCTSQTQAFGTDHFWSKIFKGIDANNDDEITFDEFLECASAYLTKSGKSAVPGFNAEPEVWLERPHAVVGRSFDGSFDGTDKFLLQKKASSASSEPTIEESAGPEVGDTSPPSTEENYDL